MGRCLVFKVIFGSFGTLVSKWPLARTTAVERNGLNLGRGTARTYTGYW